MTSNFGIFTRGQNNQATIIFFEIHKVWIQTLPGQKIPTLLVKEMCNQLTLSPDNASAGCCQNVAFSFTSEPILRQRTSFLIIIYFTTTNSNSLFSYYDPNPQMQIFLLASIVLKKVPLAFEHIEHVQF